MEVTITLIRVTEDVACLQSNITYYSIISSKKYFYTNNWRYVHVCKVILHIIALASKKDFLKTFFKFIYRLSFKPLSGPQYWPKGHGLNNM